MARHGGVSAAITCNEVENAAAPGEATDSLQDRACKHSRDAQPTRIGKRLLRLGCVCLAMTAG